MLELDLVSTSVKSIFFSRTLDEAVQTLQRKSYYWVTSILETIYIFFPVSPIKIVPEKAEVEHLGLNSSLLCS